MILAVQRSHLSIDLFHKDNKTGITDSSIAPSNKIQFNHIHSFYWMPNDQDRSEINITII
jgi:hypothetical protein